MTSANKSLEKKIYNIQTIPTAHAHDVSKQIPREKKFYNI